MSMEKRVPAFLRKCRAKICSTGVPWVLDLEVRSGDEEISISRNSLRWFSRKDSVFLFEQDVVIVHEKYRGILQRFKDIFYEDVFVDPKTEVPLLEELLDHFQLNWFIGSADDGKENEVLATK